MMDYYINVNITLALFYGFYHLVLRRSVFFLANRIFLLSGLGLAFIIPALNLQVGNFNTVLPDLFSLQTLPGEASLTGHGSPLSILLDPVSIVAEQAAPSSAGILSSLTIWEWVFIAYSCIACLFLLRIFFRISQLLRFYRKNRVIRREGYWLVLLENRQQPPSSFFNFIFISSTDLQQEGNWILQHELVHVKQVHSLDILLSEIVKAILWINPFVYLYQVALRSVNEYAADAIVPQEEKSNYARLMYACSFRGSSLSLQNSFFNKTLLKRRIKMLYQKKTAKMRAAYLLIIPLLAILLAFTSRRGERPLDPVLAKSGQAGFLKEQPAVQTSLDPAATDETSAEISETSTRIVETSAGISETATASQTITVTGTITNIANQTIAGASIFVKGTPHGTATDLKGHFELQNIPSDAQLEISMIGYETELITLRNNRTVNIRLRRQRERLEGLVIRGYTSKEDEPEKKNVTDPGPFQKPEEPVYQFASLEKMPSFPGGREMLVRHIGKRFRYPAKARNNNVEGMIEIGFIVDKEGNVTEPEILKGIGSGCDEEALRVIKTLPQWEPGEQNGVKVAVYYVVPLNLDLE